MASLNLKSSGVAIVCCTCMLILISVSVVDGVCDCCKSTAAKLCCNACVFAGKPEFICKNTCCFPCKLSDGEPSVADFCKLGCASSKCSNLDAVVDGNDHEQHQNAVELCHNACHNFCTKDANRMVIEA